jgi:uncharacterized membrane protein YcgQ (UPF0703/DUF1980 family)
VLSYLHAIPTGASVVLVNICAFVLAVLIEKCKTMVNLSKCSMIVMLPLILFSCAPEKKEYSGELAQSTEPEKVITSEPQVLQKKQDIIEIKEKMFIALSNDVYLNAPDYLGKTIKLEGLFKKQHVEYEGEPATTYYYVLRYGPGCCGADGTAGFEVAWEPRDQSLTKYPEEDAWVEAVGVLKEYSEGEMKYLFIALQSLRELEKRGAEFVSQ